MPMMIMCSKGCGVAINVSDEMLDEAKKAGVPVDTHHEVCPNEESAPLRKFKITTTVDELIMVDGELLRGERVASIGDEAEAKTFKEALPKLGEALNNQWSKVLGMADIVDT